MSLDSMGPTPPNNARMIHSLSTPSGVDGTISSSQRGGKKLAVRIQMLDDTVTMFQVQAKALAKVLFEQVCRQLNLLEADYFGLEYQEQGSSIKYWLDLEKPLNRQIGLSLIEPVLRFCVKFYTPDPSQLEEEFTRFLFCLQIKRDLATGALQCSDNTAALMASYIVQASCGDFVAEDYPDHTYLASYRFVPHQDATMQRKIMENHKKHIGQTPAEADLSLLETARRCELYGMKMHVAKDIEGVPLNLAVAHMGIAVFQGITRINTFSWAKMRKISFKRKRFLVKLHPEGYGYYKDTVDFYFEGRNECKNFWKKCVENHGFFRCTSITNTPRRKAKVLTRGSSFRYSGKTQKQIVEFVRDNYVKRQTFQRSQSFRQGTLHANSRSQSHTSCNVNSSMSAHPLLPIENAEWDYRNRDKNLMPTSQMTKSADSSVHQRDNHTDPMRSHVTAAQVEIYQTKNYASDSPQSVPDRSDSNHIVSSTVATWTSPNHQQYTINNNSNNNNNNSNSNNNNNSSSSNNNNNNNTREVDRAHVRPDDHNLETYHGINGNVSLNRRGELITTPQQRSDLTLGSDKSSSLSRSEGGVYDVVHAENQLIKLQQTPNNINHNNNNINNNNNQSIVNGGNIITTTTTTMTTTTTLESNDAESKKKKWPTDKAYFLAKEILMTERTFKKELDILNNWFREELSENEIDKLSPFFQHIDSLIESHSEFLRDLEHRLLLWEGHGTHQTHCIGDVMLKNMVVLPIYEEYIESHLEVIEHLHELYESDEHFQQIYREFEQQKVCYIPIGYLVLKPLYRLLHYQLILEMLLDHYTEKHNDRTDCLGALVMLSRINDVVRKVLPDSENYQLLCELQRDLDGFDCLVQNDRKLIRQGCLLKHSKRGLQQRMFFLFSDVLLYGSKSSVNQAFKILGHVPVRSLLTENAEHNAFVIFGGQRAITVSAGTTAEKTLWLAELSKASLDIKSKNLVQLSTGSLKNCSSSEEGLETCGINTTPQVTNKTPASRSNTALHVCWHRGATVGLRDHLISAENQLSGYLLRKFKNSSGWQKLWVVFTSFCLYFYKNYQDEFALASLPLLGYTVGPPGYQDAVQKEFVFKLSFKNHVYFFRAESEHTYNRWLDVLRSTTQTQDFKNLSS